MRSQSGFKIRHIAYLLVALTVTLTLVAGNSQAAGTRLETALVSTGAPASLDLGAAAGPDAPEPLVITYQGQLLDRATGQPKPDGTYNAVFRLYALEAGGTPLWSEGQAIVTSKGLFTVQLGNQTGAAIDPGLFDGYGRWLSVSIEPEGELLPRIRVAHAPYAIWANLALNASNADRLGGSLPSFYRDVGNMTAGLLSTDRYRAIDDLSVEGFLGNAAGDIALNNGALQATLNADSLDGLDYTAFARSVHNHDSAYVNTTGDSMSGTLNVSVPATGSHGVSSFTASTATGAAGVEAKNNGAGYGLNAYSANSYAVLAQSGTAVAGPGKAAVRGLVGTASSTMPAQEAGVWGEAANGYGVAGQSTSNYGVWAYSSNSTALYAATPSTSVALAVLNSSSGGYAISSTSSNSRAVYASGGGDVASYGYGTGGYGVYGYSDATTSGYAGVGGHAAGTSGTVYGVKGSCNSSNPSCYAAYFIGRVAVTGALTKGSGAFKIDHPLDPENKYLYHSFVESPDMMNIYNGNVVLDEQGAAWVEMPAWFEALNQDFRYQLTAIGGPGPNLYIAQKIQGNRFQIAGGSAGLEVSWQVTGIRHDPYAEAHRIPVEEMKPAEEAGTYLYPDVYGQPDSMATNSRTGAVPAPAADEAPGGIPDTTGLPVPAGQSEGP